MITALMLYAALASAKARANVRMPPHASLTLLLDNPFGTTSLKSYLDTVRKVTQKVRIQWVACTALEDLEVLEAMPIRLRLRHRTDARTRERVVDRIDKDVAEHLIAPAEVLQASTRYIEIARQVRTAQMHDGNTPPAADHSEGSEA